MKKLAIVVGALSILFNVFFCVRESNLAIMLSANGLKSGSITYFTERDEIAGRQFSFFQTTTNKGEPVLVQAERTKLGFWKIVKEERLSENKHFIDLSWVDFAGTRRYTEKENAIREKEWHFVYCGDDAIKAIELYPEQLPENAAVNIQQAGEVYLIHIVVYGEGEFSLGVRTALEENGCVTPLT